MKVPKPVLIGLLFSAALFAGYEINEAMHAESAPASVAAAPAARAVTDLARTARARRHQPHTRRCPATARRLPPS